MKIKINYNLSLIHFAVCLDSKFIWAFCRLRKLSLLKINLIWTRAKTKQQIHFAVCKKDNYKVILQWAKNEANQKLIQFEQELKASYKYILQYTKTKKRQSCKVILQFPKIRKYKFILQFAGCCRIGLAAYALTGLQKVCCGLVEDRFANRDFFACRHFWIL